MKPNICLIDILCFLKIKTAKYVLNFFADNFLPIRVNES